MNTLRKSSTLPGTTIDQAPLKHHGLKRIVVCCDGTWQDGINKNYRWQYSNALKISRIVERRDARFDPPVQQLVFYQSGVGTENNVYSEIVDGVIGAGLGDKIQNAYAFIAHNYAPGDEIFLFGFSRGAYTARMVAEFIGAIGILDKTQMDHFAEIFVAYQKLGKTSKPEEQEELKKSLEPFISPDAPGKKYAQSEDVAFTIKCLGVFDTVGVVGLPGVIAGKSQEVQMFGFNNRHLGTHIERALHALALNETRDDYTPALFEQSEEGQRKGQVLRQCWFAGSHSDVGGGYEYHDLSDISLTWMLSNVEDVLALDLHYLGTLLNPAAPWGEQIPHSAKVGIFELARSSNRAVPSALNVTTQETVHPSVLNQKAVHAVHPEIHALLKEKPEILWTLQPLELQVQNTWPFVPGARSESDEISTKNTTKEQAAQRSFMKGISREIKQVMKAGGEDRAEEADPESFTGVKVVHDHGIKTWFSTLLHALRA